MTFGNYTLASDNFLSVWVQDDWTGGGQVEDLAEVSHAERYRHATADTLHPRMLTQPPETIAYTVAGTPTACTPIGDYAMGGTLLFWAAFDTDLCYWDKTAGAFVAVDTLAAFPAGARKGVVYDDLLWIPQGASGFDRFDGASATHSTALDPAENAAGITPVSFLEWDDKLLALEHDGQVSIWDGVSWDSPAELRLRGNRTPRHLVLWWSQEGFPTVFVVTSRDVWAVDPLVPTLYRTGLRFPVHPDQGRGAAAWRDDAMYVSVGMGVHQLSRGGTISAMGLDRDDGMPASLRGVIVDLEPEYNGMLALAQGVGTVTVGSDDTLGPTIEETLLFGDALVAPAASATANSTLQRWTGRGWHTVWESTGATGTPTTVMVSEADDEYRLWWGYGGSMHTQPLRRTFYNPRQGAQLGIDRFAQSSYLRTGRFDANLTNFKKLASHLELHLDKDSRGEVDVYYASDRFEGTRLLGTVSGTGQQHLMFDADGDGWSEGEAFTWVEFEYHLRNTSPTETVIINWVSLYFIVVPLQGMSWRMGIPLRHDEQWTGRGPREIADHLDALAIGERFPSFKHRDRVYRVYLTQTVGEDATGDDLTGNRAASLIAVGPQPGAD